MYPEIYNPSVDHRDGHWKRRIHDETFRCLQCDARVPTLQRISGVQNRNHCPYCLCSRHLDYLKAGDRLSACKAVMQPIGLTVKPGRNKYGGNTHGELMLIHRCSECGKISINRLAADDQLDRLLEIYYASLGIDASIHNQLTYNGIFILQREDWILVVDQLRGNKKI